MYEIKKDELTRKNVFAGDFPIVKDVGEVATGKTVRRFAPVALTADGIVEAEAPSGSGDTAKPGNQSKAQDLLTTFPPRIKNTSRSAIAVLLGHVLVTGPWGSVRSPRSSPRCAG